MKAALARLLAFGAFWPGSALSLDDPMKPKRCDAGHALAQETPPGGYNFAHDSWVRPYNNAFAYYACIENDDQTRDLFVYWHIPGIRTILGYHDSYTKPRIFPDHPTVTVNGCLIYGNNREVMKADFLGHHDELATAQNEGDCRGLRPQPRAVSGSSSGFPSFDADGRLIFPTNIGDATRSLVRFIYSIGLRERGEGYVVSLSYAAAPVDPANFKGDLKDLRIRPSNEFLGEMWAKYGFDGPLRENQRTFELPLSTPKNAVLVQQSYQIIDSRNEVIDEIPAPFLGEGAK